MRRTKMWRTVDNHVICTGVEDLFNPGADFIIGV